MRTQLSIWLGTSLPFLVTATLTCSLWAEPPNGSPASGRNRLDAKASASDMGIEGDVVVRSHLLWTDQHYRIHGNLVLEPGGVLEVERSTVELLNAYSRQFRYLWRGGKLVTRQVTLGGTMREGVIRQSNLEVLDGEWEATDTTVRYVYGITVGGEKLGKIRATNLIAGPNPDSVIMNGKGDVVLKDSAFAVSLTCYVNGGGRGEFDLPVNKTLSRVFDATNVPGAPYRLELVNCKVPLWFLFIGGVTPDGPCANIVLKDCPRLIPSIMGSDLRGTVHLPLKLDRAVTVGNVTIRPQGKPVGTPCWGVYLSGEKTNLTLTGPTGIAELMLWAGRANLVGDPTKLDAQAFGTTIDVGQDGAQQSAELHIRNAKVGRFAGGNDDIQGQLTATGHGSIVIEGSRCDNLTLVTRDQGTITLRDIRQEGKFKLLCRGGPIRVPQAPKASSAPL